MHRLILIAALFIGTSAHASIFTTEIDCETCETAEDFGAFAAGSMNNSLAAFFNPFMNTITVTNPETGYSATVLVDLSPWKIEITVFGFVTLSTIHLPDGTIQMDVTLKDSDGVVVGIKKVVLGIDQVYNSYNAIVAAIAAHKLAKAASDFEAEMTEWLDAGGDPEQAAWDYLDNYFGTTGHSFEYYPPAPPEAPTCVFTVNIPESEVLGYESNTVTCS